MDCRDVLPFSKFGKYNKGGKVRVNSRCKKCGVVANVGIRREHVQTDYEARFLKCDTGISLCECGAYYKNGRFWVKCAECYGIKKAGV